MSSSWLGKGSIALLAVALTFSISGCGQEQGAQGPELGEIEAYLQENPEERLDNPDEAGSEEEEFEAGS